MVRAEFFALNKLELGYDRIDARWWFFFYYSLSTFFERICISRFVLDVTITVVELQIRFICLFFSYFWKKRGGSNQKVDEYSNLGSARFVQKIHNYWNVRRQMAPAPKVYLSEHRRTHTWYVHKAYACTFNLLISNLS